LAREQKFQKLSGRLGACTLFADENEVQNKHVESLRIACLDEGSNPSNSTTHTTKALFRVPFFITHSSPIKQLNAFQQGPLLLFDV